MRPIIAVCSVLAILAPGQLWGKDWALELEGSWCVTHLDDEFYDLEATTAVGLSAAANLSYGRAYSRVEYALSWSCHPDDQHGLQVDRGDAFVLLGYRVLNAPQILPYFGFRHVSTGAGPGNPGASTRDSRYQGCGIGLRVENASGEKGIAGFADGFLLPWGSWESERHNSSVMPGEGPSEYWEDDSPRCYGGSVGASYQLPQSKASLVADVRFVVTRHESEEPGTFDTQRFEQIWQGVTLGLRYEF
ncbi:hypothetical protein JXA88_10470 [Candidatus Fermentibacteria bacterium]|nr:hypothetical protein [Candidatus Fermentibacteria bacterium]